MQYGHDRAERIEADISGYNGGPLGVPATAQAWRFRPRSVEYQQIGPWSMAIVEDTGIGNRATIEILHKLGATEPCAITVAI